MAAFFAAAGLYTPRTLPTHRSPVSATAGLPPQASARAPRALKTPMTVPLRSILLSGADVNVDFDLSFIAQVVLFALFLMLLKPILFDPMMRLFEERDLRTDGARAAARKMDERAAELIARYEGELEAVRREAAKDRDVLRAQTQKLEAQILDEAKQEATRILDQGRAQIATEVAALRSELQAARPALAEQIATRLLGREVRS